MADLEVINHLRKSIDVWRQPQHSMWHKIKEFLLEIGIIVFAVSLSIGLHTWSEDRHEQHEVREFLRAVKDDLNYDISVYEQSRSDYQTKAEVFSQLTHHAQAADTGLISRLYSVIHDFDVPIPSHGHYESFKFSGKLGLLPDKGISGNLIKLFEEDNRRLQNQVDFYTRLQTLYHDRLNDLLVFDSTSASNIKNVVAQGVNYNLARDLMNTRQVVAGYSVCINRMYAIVRAIDKAYPDLHS